MTSNHHRPFEQRDKVLASRRDPLEYYTLRGGASRQRAGMKWRSYPSGKYRSYQPVLREGGREGGGDREREGGREGGRGERERYRDRERQRDRDRERERQRRERESKGSIKHMYKYLRNLLSSIDLNSFRRRGKCLLTSKCLSLPQTNGPNH